MENKKIYLFNVKSGERSTLSQVALPVIFGFLGMTAFFNCNEAKEATNEKRKSLSDNILNQSTAKLVNRSSNKTLTVTINSHLVNISKTDIDKWAKEGVVSEQIDMVLRQLLNRGRIGDFMQLLDDLLEYAIAKDPLFANQMMDTQVFTSEGLKPVIRKNQNRSKDSASDSFLGMLGSLSRYYQLLDDKKIDLEKIETTKGKPFGFKKYLNALRGLRYSFMQNNFVTYRTQTGQDENKEKSFILFAPGTGQSGKLNPSYYDPLKFDWLVDSTSRDLKNFLKITELPEMPVVKETLKVRFKNKLMELPGVDESKAAKLTEELFSESNVEMSGQTSLRFEEKYSLSNKRRILEKFFEQHLQDSSKVLYELDAVWEMLQIYWQRADLLKAQNDTHFFFKEAVRQRMMRSLSANKLKQNETAQQLLNDLNTSNGSAFFSKIKSYSKSDLKFLKEIDFVPDWVAMRFTNKGELVLDFDQVGVAGKQTSDAARGLIYLAYLSKNDAQMKALAELIYEVHGEIPFPKLPKAITGGSSIDPQERIQFVKEVTQFYVLSALGSQHSDEAVALKAKDRFNEFSQNNPDIFENMQSDFKGYMPIYYGSVIFFLADELINGRFDYKEFNYQKLLKPAHHYEVSYESKYGRQIGNYIYNQLTLEGDFARYETLHNVLNAAAYSEAILAKAIAAAEQGRHTEAFDYYVHILNQNRGLIDGNIYLQRLAIKGLKNLLKQWNQPGTEYIWEKLVAQPLTTDLMDVFVKSMHENDFKTESGRKKIASSLYQKLKSYSGVTISSETPFGFSHWFSSLANASELTESQRRSRRELKELDQLYNKTLEILSRSENQSNGSYEQMISQMQNMLKELFKRNDQLELRLAQFDSWRTLGLQREKELKPEILSLFADYQKNILPVDKKHFASASQATFGGENYYKEKLWLSIFERYLSLNHSYSYNTSIPDTIAQKLTVLKAVFPEDKNLQALIGLYQEAYPEMASGLDPDVLQQELKLIKESMPKTAVYSKLRHRVYLMATSLVEKGLKENLGDSAKVRTLMDARLKLLMEAVNSLADSKSFIGSDIEELEDRKQIADDLKSALIFHFSSLADFLILDLSNESIGQNVEDEKKYFERIREIINLKLKTSRLVAKEAGMTLGSLLTTWTSEVKKEKGFTQDDFENQIERLNDIAQLDRNPYPRDTAVLNYQFNEIASGLGIVDYLPLTEKPQMNLQAPYQTKSQYLNYLIEKAQKVLLTKIKISDSDRAKTMKDLNWIMIIAQMKLAGLEMSDQELNIKTKGESHFKEALSLASVMIGSRSTLHHPLNKDQLIKIFKNKSQKVSWGEEKNKGDGEFEIVNHGHPLVQVTRLDPVFSHLKINVERNTTQEPLMTGVNLNQVVYPKNWSETSTENFDARYYHLNQLSIFGRFKKIEFDFEKNIKRVNFAEKTFELQDDLGTLKIVITHLNGERESFSYEEIIKNEGQTLMIVDNKVLRDKKLADYLINGEGNVLQRIAARLDKTFPYNLGKSNEEKFYPLKQLLDDKGQELAFTAQDVKDLLVWAEGKNFTGANLTDKQIYLFMDAIIAEIELKMPDNPSIVLARAKTLSDRIAISDTASTEKKVLMQGMLERYQQFLLERIKANVFADKGKIVRGEIKDNIQLQYALQAINNMTDAADYHRESFAKTLKENTNLLEKKSLQYFERAAVNGILPEELLPYFVRFLVVRAQKHLQERDLPNLRKDLDYLNAVFYGKETNETGTIAYLIKRNKKMTATIVMDRSLKKADIRPVINRINSALGGN